MERWWRSLVVGVWLGVMVLPCFPSERVFAESRSWGPEVVDMGLSAAGWERLSSPLYRQEGRGDKWVWGVTFQELGGAVVLWRGNDEELAAHQLSLWQEDDHTATYRAGGVVLVVKIHNNAEASRDLLRALLESSRYAGALEAMPGLISRERTLGRADALGAMLELGWRVGQCKSLHHGALRWLLVSLEEEGKSSLDVEFCWEPEAVCVKAMNERSPARRGSWLRMGDVLVKVSGEGERSQKDAARLIDALLKIRH